MIIFQNPGVIDEVLITTIGCNVKENDSAIGYFGTGLKYAIAVLLREGQDIIIWRGLMRYSFSLHEEEIRGKTFQFIVMHIPRKFPNEDACNQRLGFTTEFGKNWTLEHAYRELFCNAKDEKGWTLFEKNDDLAICLAKPDLTTIIVSGKAFEKVHQNSSAFILSPSLPPIYFSEDLEIYNSPSPKLFYRGIAALELTRPSLFTYNILAKSELTEDRTFANTWAITYIIAEYIVRMEKSPEIVEKILLAKDSYENSLPIEYQNPSETFCSAVERLLKTEPMKLREDAVKIVRKAKPTLENDLYQDYVMTKEEKAKLGRAIEFCTGIGYPVLNFEIRIVHSLGNGILGMASRKTIFLSKELFQTSSLEHALIEEFFHLITGMSDCTRSFQSYIFGELVFQGKKIQKLQSISIDSGFPEVNHYNPNTPLPF